MTKDDYPKDKKSQLRKRAERMLTKSADDLETAKLSPDDMQQLVHELRVHQIELELQNEELCRAQLSIEQARDRYVDLYDYAPVAYFTLDTKGIITETNLTAVRLFGIEMEVFIKTPFSRLVSKNYQDVFYFHLRQALEAESSVTCELTLTKKSGELLHAQVESEATQDDEGNLSGLRVIVTDITERKRLEEELSKSHDELDLRVQERTRELQRSNAALERSNADLQQFAYVASHDLQEPLRTVTSSLQIFAKRNKGQFDKHSDQLIDYAVDGAKRMKALIQDLLAYSRVTSHGQSFKAVDMNKILDQSIKNCGSLINEKGTSITYDEMPTVTGDPTLLTQLLQNLIGNAVKFSHEQGGKVHVSAQQNGNDWVFSVEDNGIGIEENYFEKIFVIFHQLSKKGPFDGTGIGLAIVKKIVERHGGRVWVESEVGKGSTFYFAIPNGTRT